MTLELLNPMDMHCHLREGALLESVLPFSTSQFSAALAMPNLKTPITTTDLALSYKAQILSLTKTPFMPILSIYLTQNLSKDELLKAKANDIHILKLYPKGATTNSESGVSNVLDDKSLQIFEIAEQLNFILSIHGESSGFCLDREFEFLAVFEQIAKTFPKLRIIIEHLSDRRSLDLLERYENLYATLTLHHISMNLDDLCGGALNPHHFCKPMLKSKKDMQALLQAAISAHSKISFGSDSAPHLESTKLSGAAGIFSAPIALCGLAEIFEKHNALDNLQAFVSDRAIANYNLANFPKKRIVLTKTSHKVASHITTTLGNIIPLRANCDISWSIKP